MTNKLRFQMSAEDQAAVEQHMAAIEELIKPHVTTLSPHDRKHLSRATDSRMRTLVRGLEHLEQNVQLSMAYAPVDEIRRDYDGKIVFDKWVLRIETIRSQMSDAAVLSSHEFYREMRNTYHNAQRMLDLPGAPQFVEMTAELFKKASHGTDEEEATIPAGTGALN